MQIGEIHREIQRAEARLRPHLRETRLAPSPWLGEPAGASVYCKLENLQPTGSFKVRGAANKVLSLTPEERRRGVVTASSGNAGAAMAWVLGRVGAEGVVFVPEDAPASKLAKIESLGARLERCAGDVARIEARARVHAAARGMIYLPPYNDPLVVAGQGTIAAELSRQLAGIDAVFASVGGGGLVSGIGSFLKHVSPQTRVVGCWPENSDVMKRSLEAGRILDLPSRPTLSDATAGGIEPGALTFDLCRRVIDECVTVTEAEIAVAMRDFLAEEHMAIEGAAGVAVAAWRKTGSDYAGARVAIVICGGNVDSATLERIGAGTLDA